METWKPETCIHATKCLHLVWLLKLLTLNLHEAFHASYKLTSVQLWNIRQFLYWICEGFEPQLRHTWRPVQQKCFPDCTTGVLNEKLMSIPGSAYGLELSSAKQMSHRFPEISIIVLFLIDINEIRYTTQDPANRHLHSSFHNINGLGRNDDGHRNVSLRLTIYWIINSIFCEDWFFMPDLMGLSQS